MYILSVFVEKGKMKKIEKHFFGFVTSRFTKSLNFIMGIPSSHANFKLPFSTQVSLFKLKVCMCTFPSIKIPLHMSLNVT